MPNRAELSLFAALLAGCSGHVCPPRVMPVVAEPAAIAAPEPAFGFQEVVRKMNYQLTFGPYTLEVDPADGGRIVAFALDGRSVVLSRAESSEAYGSSFWTSPQSDWKWPPPPELDKAAWRATKDGASLRLQSDTITASNLAAEQRISADLARQSIVIDYTLSNRGATARRVAPWQNTRVRPNGLTLFPSSTPNLPQSTLELSREAGIAWLQHDAASMRRSGKAFADGSEGWLAHVDGDLLFVKIFPDVPPQAQAPGEAEIELYVHETGQFVEMEQQGAYVEIAPGAHSTWRVQWALRRLPPALAARPRQPALVDWIRELVAGVRRG
jgi:hypothetical protein